ncbi:Protein of unknown function [Pyronema omphalodes CBS 100304]|uniref:Uncharacterized protein n=1 Tax=Pyronema omphalodes (strain CBS 100304) TaxID=1076935 RepID=U4LFC6_PYROM|nr:Protein of unknown function [Pyronema omphalodes CBS 100304]
MFPDFRFVSPALMIHHKFTTLEEITVYGGISGYKYFRRDPVEPQKGAEVSTGSKHRLASSHRI